MDQSVGGYPNCRFGRVGESVKFGAGSRGGVAASDEDADGLVDACHVRQSVDARVVEGRREMRVEDERVRTDLHGVGQVGGEVDEGCAAQKFESVSGPWASGCMAVFVDESAEHLLPLDMQG